MGRGLTAHSNVAVPEATIAAVPIRIALFESGSILKSFGIFVIVTSFALPTMI